MGQVQVFGGGDYSIYASLTSRLPRVVAAYIGELSVDLPAKLLSVGVALAVARACFWQQRTVEAARAAFAEVAAG